MNVIFKRLEIENFQGIKEYSCDFNMINHVVGKNGVGKTTILNAILWLITGKDINDNADSNFKLFPQDSNGNINLYDKPSVRLIISVDGEENMLYKQREFDLPKRKEPDPNVKYKTKALYQINNLNYTPKMWDSKISDFFGDINTYKSASSLLYFLEHVDWKTQREFVLSNIKDVSHQEICELDKKFEKLSALKEIPFNNYLQQIKTELKTAENIIKDSNLKLGVQKANIKELGVDKTENNDSVSVELEELETELSSLKKAKILSEQATEEYSKMQAKEVSKKNEIELFKDKYDNKKEYLINLKNDKITATKKRD